MTPAPFFFAMTFVPVITSMLISDIDECDLGIDTCHLRATCENIDGSYICECSEGYHGNGHSCRRKLNC